MKVEVAASYMEKGKSSGYRSAGILGVRDRAFFWAMNTEYKKPEVLAVADTLRTLGELLRDVDALDWKHATYLPYSDAWIGDDGYIQWTASTPCAVLDPQESETDKPDDAPPFAKKHGFNYALGISEVKDIVANARLQRPNVDAEGLVEAFMHYIDHDAFIVFP